MTTHLPLRLILVKSSTVPLGRRAVDKFNGCSSWPGGPAAAAAVLLHPAVHPSMSAMLCAVGVLGGLPYTWGCHVPEATAGSSGDDGTVPTTAAVAATAAPDRSAGGFLLLQSIIINISHGSRHTGANVGGGDSGRRLTVTTTATVTTATTTHFTYARGA